MDKPQKTMKGIAAKIDMKDGGPPIVIVAETFSQLQRICDWRIGPHTPIAKNLCQRVIISPDESRLET